MQLDPAAVRDPGEQACVDPKVSDGNRDGNTGRRQRPAATVNNHVPPQDLT